MDLLKNVQKAIGREGEREREGEEEEGMEGKGTFERKGKEGISRRVVKRSCRGENRIGEKDVRDVKCCNNFCILSY